MAYLLYKIRCAGAYLSPASLRILFAVPVGISLPPCLGIRISFPVRLLCHLSCSLPCSTKNSHFSLAVSLILMFSPLISFRGLIVARIHTYVNKKIHIYTCFYGAVPPTPHRSLFNAGDNSRIIIPFRQTKRKMAETLDISRNFSHLPISLL